MGKKLLPHLYLLDGLRAIGILWIVWYHIWQQSWLSSNFVILGNYINIDLIPRTGFLGVELILFISGFGLFYSYRKRRLENKDSDSLKKYFLRRVMRIYPSYVLAIFVILLFFTPFSNISDIFYHLLMHLFFLQNFFMETSRSINGVFWVLSIEVQFYLIFPLFSRFFHKFPFPTFISMVLIAIGYRQVIQVHELENIGFYLNQLPGFFDLYAFGMLSAYILTTKRKKIFEILVSKLFFFSLSLFTIVVLFFMLNKLDSAPFSPSSAYIWQADNRQYLGLLFLLFSVTTSLSIKIWQKFFSNRILIFISTISYNLFIWHQLIAIQLKKNHIPTFLGDPHKDINWQVQFTLLVIVLSLFVSVFITYLFEEPIKKHGVKKYLGLIITRLNL